MSPAAPPARPPLQVISAGASPEEVAAIVAAVTVALGARGTASAGADEVPSAWITASRLRARRAGVRRGDWRHADRLGGRVPT